MCEVREAPGSPDLSFDRAGPVSSTKALLLSALLAALEMASRQSAPPQRCGSTSVPGHLWATRRVATSL